MAGEDLPPPLPGEIREIDGVPKIWIPDPPGTTRTHTIFKNPFQVSGNYPVLNVTGYGYIKEVVVVSDKPMDLYVNTDDVDVLNGHNSFDDLSGISAYSDTITARFDDPYYSMRIQKIHFSNSAKVSLYGMGAMVYSLLCVYDVTER